MFTLFVRKHVDVIVLWIKFFLYVFLSTSLLQRQFLKALPTLTNVYLALCVGVVRATTTKTLQGSKKSLNRPTHTE